MGVFIIKQDLKSNFSLNDVCKFLKKHDNFAILCHKSPDGDTLGSAFALKEALLQQKKSVLVFCNDPLPEKFSFLGSFDDIKKISKKMIFIAIDIADSVLFGEKLFNLKDSISLCIDHHLSNTFYSQHTFLRHCASTGEIIFDIISLMKMEITQKIASFLYTAIATDTGCFKYPNTTFKTHEIASSLIKIGCNHSQINKIFFETKTLSQIKFEAEILSNIEMHFNNICASIYIKKDRKNFYGLLDSDLDFISSIPREIDGVKIGVTFKEVSNSETKISIRTNDEVDASLICSNFGGGGHKNAAGCSICENLSKAKKMVLNAIKNFLEESTLL